MKRTSLFALLGVVIVIVGLGGYFLSRDSHESSHDVSIGIATWPGFAPAFLAKDRGYFGDLNVSVHIADDFSARRAAFTSGRDDFTIYTIDSLAFDAGKGVDGQVVLVLDESNGADGIIAKPGIQSAADLRGKTIAYTRGSPSHFFLVNYLKEAGLSISDVKTVEVDDPTRAAEAFISGTVDAAVTWEPYLSQIRSKNLGTIIADTRSRPGEIIDVLVASRSVVRDRPDVVRQVVQGWLKALAEVDKPRADTIAILARGLGMKEPDFRGAAEGVAFANPDKNRYWLQESSDGSSRAEALFAASANTWRSENLSAAPSITKPYFAPEFVLNSQGP